MNDDLCTLPANWSLNDSQTICKTGKQKAPVLPLPVSAALKISIISIIINEKLIENGNLQTISTSPPPSIAGIASDWISVGNLKILITRKFLKEI